MPHFSIPIAAAGGALLDAYIGVSQARRTALTAASQPAPDSQRVRALLDTGASCTCVDPIILTALGIPSTGTTQMNSPTTGANPQTVNVYDVSIGIPGATPPPFFLGTVAVAEAQLLQVQGFHAIIGRDILASWVIHYNGPLSLVTVSY